MIRLDDSGGASKDEPKDLGAVCCDTDYRHLFELAHDAIVIFEPEGEKVLEVNQRACELYGLPRDRFVGTSLRTLSANVDRGQEHVETTLTLGERHSFETVQYRADGSEMALEINAAVVRYRGELAILSINRDVTERKRAEALRTAKEAAEEANRAKTEFLANMSHEIRTPMTGILGVADVLMRSPLPAESRDHVQLLRSSANSLLRLLDDILDLSKIEAGKLSIERRGFALRTVVSEVVGLVRSRADAKGLELTLELEDLPVRVEGDAGRLRQILMNLISNALKFTAEGWVRLTVETLGDVPPVGETANLRFVVEDTGIGIPDEVRESLFAPFSQGDAAIGRAFGGTGLGLAISKQLVSAMGGEIGVEGRGAQGARFWFTLPLEVAPVDPDGPLQPMETLAEEDRGADPRVLVAEDDPINQLVVQALLERLGYDATVVSDGFQVLTYLEHGGFDAVLMDWRMPGLDGLEVTRRIRELGDERACIPVIALTANAMRGDREKCLAAGMNAYLSKPVRPDELAATLETSLRPVS
ncbi:MAG: ATP-binding protein [Acidobacteriota bacterium]